MLTQRQHLSLTSLGVLACVIVGANGWLVVGNRATQAEVNARQQFIQQSAGIESLYREMAKALAERALQNHDDAVLQMLGSQGISVSGNAAPPASAAR